MCSIFTAPALTRGFYTRLTNSLAAHPPLMPEPITMASWVCCSVPLLCSLINYHFHRKNNAHPGAAIKGRVIGCLLSCFISFSQLQPAYFLPFPERNYLLGLQYISAMPSSRLWLTACTGCIVFARITMLQLNAISTVWLRHQQVR